MVHDERGKCLQLFSCVWRCLFKLLVSVWSIQDGVARVYGARV